MPSTATASVAAPPVTIASALPSSFSSTSFSTFSVGVGSASGPGFSGHQLRHSSSLANVRPSSAASNSPRERRRPSLSVSPSSFHASSLSPDSYTSKLRTGSTGSTTSFMSPPPSPPPPNSRLEEHYLAAKRRTHRQSYFDHYPERNSPHLREERKAATDELDVLVGAKKDKSAKGKERVEVLLDTRPEVVADAKQEATAGPSERKSRLAASSSMQKTEAGSSTESDVFRGCDFSGQTSIPPAPPARPPRSSKRATIHASTHPPLKAATAAATAATTTSVVPTLRMKTARPTTGTSTKADGHVLRTPKIPTHPYGAFRGDGCPDLRMSNSTYSSSQTHRGSPSPPQTPIEVHSQRSSYEPIEVMVAPDFDVEAMDALVDGMDGSSDDDLFQRLQRTVAKSDFGGRHSTRDHQHHPLYAPPLPEPPEGVVLGRARTCRPDDLRFDSMNSLGNRHELFSGQDGNWDEYGEVVDGINRPTSLGRKPFPTVSDKEKTREMNGRTASSSTIIADMVSHSSSSQTTTIDEPHSQTHKGEPMPRPVKEVPLSIDEIIRKHTSKPAYVPLCQRPSSSAIPDPSSSASTSTSAERPNTARASSNVPSISEIIQKHMPPDTRKSCSPIPSSTVSAPAASVHGKQQRRPVLVPQRQASSTSDSEPEVPDSADGSRSGGLTTSASTDSISAEARHALSYSSVQSSNASFSHSGEGGPSLNRRHSTYSGKVASASRSATGGGKASSVRSGSASASISKGTTYTSDNLFSEPDILSGLSANLTGACSAGGSGRKKQSAQREAVATYLRSARITTLLKLMKRPHAAPDRPLNVSVSDLGAKTGLPLVVFLGLGCVRHVMGLYDEMAECMGLRLITIDRWGLGRTDVPPSSSCRGVLEWASVVDEVLEQLNIGKCSVMAHSAGSPYALAFANKCPSRIVGDICLLAPWVGGGASGGYSWLKYVPNGILKTAQAAEWKIQAWMIGKPPKITYEGIGYNMKAPVSSASYDETEHTDRGAGARAARGFDEEEEDEETRNASGYDEELDELDLRPDEMGLKIEPLDAAKSMNNNPYPSAIRTQATRSGSLMGKSRPSTSSGRTLAEYDDLADFGGRFSSRSFERRRSLANDANDHEGVGFGAGKKKRGFLKRWKGTPHSNAGISNTSPPPVPPVPTILAALGPANASSGAGLRILPTQVPTDPTAQGGGKSKLRTLKSIGSLRHRSSNTSSALSTTSPKVGERSPVLPEQDFSSALDFNLSLDEFGREDGVKPNVIQSASDTSLSRNSTGRRDVMSSRRSTMYGEPSAVEGNLEHNISSEPAPSTRANGRRSISMSATRPKTAASFRTTGAATVSGRTHRSEHSVANTLGALPSTTSSNSIKTTPSKCANKLRRRQSAAPNSVDTSSISHAPSPTSASSISYQVELGNALIAASHAESSRGTHPDLLQILNHERRPWGFSYARYPHPVQVWYGDRDERIARESVEWMREKMCAKDAIAAGGDGRCEVKVVKGADHGLMFRTDVVVEVLEHVQTMWNTDSGITEKKVSPLLGMEQETAGMYSLGARLNLSPRKTTNGIRTSEKGTLRASWGYELHSDPFRVS